LLGRKSTALKRLPVAGAEPLCASRYYGCIAICRHVSVTKYEPARRERAGLQVNNKDVREVSSLPPFDVGFKMKESGGYERLG
jgi:hypothetical protein